jgi:glc operon protein GlcG
MRIPLLAAAFLAASLSVTGLSITGAMAQQGAAPGAAAQPAAAPPPPSPYGMPIDIETAKKIAAAAIAKAKTSFPSAVAIVGPAGELIYLEKMDNANNSTSELAIKKAQTAANFRRQSRFFEDALSGGRLAILGLGVTPVGGGIPIIKDGHVIGAIGASGAPSSDGDIAVAQSGLDAK